MYFTWVSELAKRANRAVVSCARMESTRMADCHLVHWCSKD